MKNIYWYDEAGLKTILENGTRYEFVTTSNPTYTQVADLLYGKGAVAVNEGTAVSNYAVATAESVGGTIAAPQMLETSVTEVGGSYKLIAETPQAVTTAGGTELSAGAVATKANPIPIVMAALYGAGLGWKSYKDYPEFWTDLSNTLIETEGYANDPDNRFLTDNVLGACKVVIRAVEDGGLQAYCDRKTLEKIYQKAWEEGAFVTESQTVPMYDTSGEYTFISGGVGFDLEMSLGGYPLLNKLDTNILNRLRANRNIIDPNHTANACSVSIYVSPTQNAYFVNLYNIQDEKINITVGSAYNSFQLKGFLGGYGLRFDPITYASQGTFYDFNNTEDAQILKGTYNGKRHESTINAMLVDPNPAIIINPDCNILTSPEDFDTQFADWIAEGWDSTEYNPETGQNETTTWLPIQIPDINDNESVNPTPEGQTDVQSGAIPSPEGVLPPQYPTGLKDLLDKLGITVPEVPEGQTPAIVAPTGPTSTASKLYTVYNPSNAQLDSLGSYLWSPSAVDTLKQLFTNSPLEAIISLHQVYCSVSTSGTKNIILGSLDSGVAAPVVSNQYVQLSCGSVSVPTLYDDARDYDNTSCELFLPFCGIVSLDPNDVIGRTVKVDYTIDLFTGTCLATLTITKDGLSQVLYNFEGNCSVMVPLTSRDRTAIAGSAISAVAGIATSLATKNPTAAVAGVAGGAVGIGTSGQSIGHTGSFTGNAGAMGIKKPYIIVTRNKSQDPVGFKSYYGFPTSRTVNLSTISGYVRVEDIKLSSLTCTDTEKDMLETLLKGGVYI